MLKLNFFSDQKFVERIQQNDQHVLAELYVRFEKMIMSYVAAQGGNSDDAEDLLQETLIVLWQNINAGKFQLKSKLSTFIMAVAKNKWMAEHRKKYYQARDQIPDNLSDGNPGGLDKLISEERLNLVQEALNEISAVCRKLLMMFYFEEKTLEELIPAFDFANTNVAKSKKYQCKKSLEKVLTAKLAEDRRVLK